MANESDWPTLGHVLVERGVLTQEHLEQALAIQRSSGGLLGEILTSRGLVTPLSIAVALARQREVLEQNRGSPPVAAGSGRGETWKPLGTILLEKGYITEVQLKQVLAAQHDQGGFIGELLVERGWLAASDLVLGLAAQLGLDFDVGRTAGGGAILPVDRPEPHFEVLEARHGNVVLLKKAATFMEATDFVFDEVLWQREPGSLQIIRVDADRHEVAWSFTPGEGATVEGDDLLSIFGYPVTQWQGDHVLYEGQDGQPGPPVVTSG